MWSYFDKIEPGLERHQNPTKVGAGGTCIKNLQNSPHRYLSINDSNGSNRWIRMESEVKGYFGQERFLARQGHGLYPSRVSSNNLALTIEHYLLLKGSEMKWQKLM